MGSYSLGLSEVHLYTLARLRPGVRRECAPRQGPSSSSHEFLTADLLSVLNALGMLEIQRIQVVVVLEVETDFRNHPMCRLHRGWRQGVVHWKGFAEEAPAATIASATVECQIAPAGSHAMPFCDLLCLQGALLQGLRCAMMIGVLQWVQLPSLQGRQQ